MVSGRGRRADRNRVQQSVDPIAEILDRHVSRIEEPVECREVAATTLADIAAPYPGAVDFDGGASVNGGTPFAPVDAYCFGLPWRRDEQQVGGPGCGLGYELVLILLPLMVLMALNRRRAHG